MAGARQPWLSGQCGHLLLSMPKSDSPPAPAPEEPARQAALVSLPHFTEPAVQVSHPLFPASRLGHKDTGRDQTDLGSNLSPSLTWSSSVKWVGNTAQG